MSQMKTVRTSDLIGSALDWAVAKAQGVEIDLPGSDVVWAKYAGAYSPSTDWSQGGQLLDKHIHLISQDGKGGIYAQCCVAPTHEFGEGPSILVAACRAIVAANLGDEVQIPAELLP